MIATPIRGELAQIDHPDWVPLEEAVGVDRAADFMWMHEVRLEDGLALHAYKHCFTRRYLHLARDGSAFAYRAPGDYVPVDRASAVRAVFRGADSLCRLVAAER